MTIKELYAEALKEEVHSGTWSLSLLIEFLVFEKKVLNWDDDKSELDLYFKPNNAKRMNELLLDFRRRNENE